MFATIQTYVHKFFGSSFVAKQNARHFLIYTAVEFNDFLEIANVGAKFTFQGRYNTVQSAIFTKKSIDCPSNAHAYYVSTFHNLMQICLQIRLSLQKMPTECITNPLQRELADSIIRMVPLDEIRILLACGAKVRNSQLRANSTLSPIKYLPGCKCQNMFIMESEIR